jgi:hypothetical protein
MDESSLHSSRHKHSVDIAYVPKKIIIAVGNAKDPVVFFSFGIEVVRSVDLDF